MELMEGQQGEAAPAQAVPSLVSSLPVRSPPTVPRHPPQYSPQPTPTSAAEQEKRREQKETQKLREKAEKLKEQAEKAKIKSERAMNEAEQRGYELGIAETEKALRAEVPEVCRIFCARTWSEALDCAGVEASSELRKPENIYYPEVIRSSAPQSYQADTPSPAVNPNEEALPRNSPPGASPNKPTTASKAETVSQGFQQELDSTVQSTGDITKK
ncbi:uncharacterized protein LOC115970292 [Quercus lobata]|uniref:uncharacterized protein LOC115970292 n=1 Tax=Quercus lobata TaxID=97700 RepID=UPI0012491C1A|nr:uncharacterized protein LOC115970292 [Quercus lobata]